MVIVVIVEMVWDSDINDSGNGDVEIVIVMIVEMVWRWCGNDSGDGASSDSRDNAHVDCESQKATNDSIVIITCIS